MLLSLFLCIYYQISELLPFPVFSLSYFYTYFILDTNETLKAFLMARNPKQQHTGTLESYLITPIQVKPRSLLISPLVPGVH